MKESESSVEESEPSESSSETEYEIKINFGFYVRLLIPTDERPFSRVLINGRSGLGKTHLAVGLVEKFFIPVVDIVFIICPSFFTQKTFKNLRRKVAKENVLAGHPTDKTFEIIKKRILKYRKIDRNYRFLLFIDDVSSDYSTNMGRKGNFASLSANAPHINLSIIACFQQATACSPAYRNNAEHIIVFPPADKSAYDIFVKEFNPYIYDKIKSKLFLEEVSKIWNKGRFVYISRIPRHPTLAFEEFNKEIKI